MKGYKGFKKGLICKGKQYAENTIFEEDSAKICESGMHFCKNPLDTLDYYPLINDDGELNEFAEVEALDEVQTNDNKKFVTKKLRVGARLDLSGFIKASIDFLFEHSKDASSGDYAQLASSEDYAQLASSGNSAQLASSEDYAQLASSGNSARLASSGISARLASSGDYAQLASSGICARLASSGNFAQLASSGNFARLASSGNSARLASSGDYCIIAGIGIKNKVKAALGSWIVLAEYDKYFKPVCVKSAQIDGKILKADAWYKLRDGKFVEVE